MIPEAYVTALMLLTVLGSWWAGVRRGRRAERKERGAGLRTEQQAIEERIAALVAEVEAARLVATAEREKCARYLLKITDFEKERSQWQELYTLQSIGHGNAQNLMMQTIEGLSRQLQTKGVEVRLPKVLRAVREEFREQHELPAKAGLPASEILAKRLGSPGSKSTESTS